MPTTPEIRTFGERRYAFTNYLLSLEFVSTGGALRSCENEECRQWLDEATEHPNGCDGSDVCYCPYPSFSHGECDGCNTPLSGVRELGHGYTSAGDLEHLSLCMDCVWDLNS